MRRRLVRLWRSLGSRHVSLLIMSAADGFRFELMHILVRIWRISQLTVQSSALVLVQYLWHQEAIEVDDGARLESCLALFQRYTTSIRPSIRRAARIGSTMLQSLMDTLRDIHLFPGRNESFVYALKRITNTIRTGDKLPITADTHFLDLLGPGIFDSFFK